MVWWFVFHRYLLRGVHRELALFFGKALITSTQLHIHTWKLPNATTVWSAGHWAAPLERLGLGALLKGTSVVVMREGYELLFHSPPPRFSCRKGGLSWLFISLEEVLPKGITANPKLKMPFLLLHYPPQKNMKHFVLKKRRKEKTKYLVVYSIITLQMQSRKEIKNIWNVKIKNKKIKMNTFTVIYFCCFVFILHTSKITLKAIHTKK